MTACVGSVSYLFISAVLNWLTGKPAETVPTLTFDAQDVIIPGTQVRCLVWVIIRGALYSKPGRVCRWAVHDHDL